MKRTKFYVGLTLCLQAASFALLFVIFCVEKKSIMKALAAVSLASGVTGLGLLMLDSSEDMRKRRAALMKAYEEFDPFADDLTGEVEISDD